MTRTHWITFALAVAALALAAAPVQEKITLQARPFDLRDVRLLDGPFRDAMLRDQKYLLELDPDRLLHNFRVNAGLPSSAAPLGGWEAPDVELRGHTVGHYLSALALMYATTGDDRFKARGDLMVAELAKVQAALPSRGFHPGYLSAYPESFIDRVETRERVWAPYYTLHKIMAGLFDMSQLCGNTQALDMLVKMADWVKFRQDRLTRAQQQAMLMTEFGGMAEVLANLYAVTGNPDHLHLAQTFDHDVLFNPLAKGEDPLNGLHANTQIPKMIGVAREYELTGDTRYRDIASFFWTRVARFRSYANGGHSDNESFFPPEEFSRHLGASSSETCNTYNMLKLTRHLFSWAPSAELMDFYERGLYNHILASQDPATGMMIYYCPLRPGAFRSYSTPNDSFWCCVGTGMENHAKYTDTIYFHDDSSLYLNLFIPSVLTWKEKGLIVRQETRFPEQDSTRLTFTAEKPTRLALKIRHPAWSRSIIQVIVNGRRAPTPEQPGMYVTVDREWITGDTVEIRVPMSLRLEAMPDDPNMVAILYGPILLAGDLGKEGLDPSRRYGPSAPPLGRMKTPAIPALVGTRASLVEAVAPVDGSPLTFRTKGLGQPHDVTLIPFYKASDVRYTVYWNTYTPAEWEKRKSELAATEARRKDLESRAIDSVMLDSDDSEKAHGFASENAGQPYFEGRRGREAPAQRGTAGWFSYDLKVTPDAPATLVCTYRGGEGRRRVFDILVDGQKIATETLPYHPTELLDVEYPIPAALTKGKTRVTVKFQPQADASTASVFEVRTVGGGQPPAPIAHRPSPASDYPIRPVPLTAVRITDDFWRPRIEINRTVTIPHIMRQNEQTGRVDNFLKAAHKISGPYKGQRYNDTDVYKVIEAASYSLAVHPDPALDKQLDDLIAIIAAAQEPDGYLYTARTADPKNPPPGTGPERWSYLHTSHELYNAGHMYEAAIAHFQATGKRTFLDIAIRNANLVCQVFGPDGRHDVPGHEEIELALVKLYRVTGDRKYLEQAQFFLDQRGRPHTTTPFQFPANDRFAIYNDLPYRQDHLPIVDQTRAVGHAVRATYLFSGITDVATLLGIDAWGQTISALWRDVTSKRIYVTGGLGSQGRTEAFGDDYVLPNRAYAETCASVGGLLWYHRMFLRDGDASYYDVFERTLYNGYLSGVSLSGDAFFYQNPLVSDGKVERSTYFDVACCPANLARLMGELSGLIYAQQDPSTVYVNLFIGSDAALKVGATPVRVVQKTEYPWQGAVTIAIDPEQPAEFTLKVRVPGWSRGEAMPSDLYRFAEGRLPATGRGPGKPAPTTASSSRVGSGFSRTDPDQPTLTVNNKPVPLALARGYATITRRWQKGDTVRLDLPMPVRRVLANDGVADDRGKAAIERGPIVYAVEAVDNGGKVTNLALPLDAPLGHQFRKDLLGGVEVVTAKGLVAVPYFAWANRGKGEMAVWIPY